MLSRENRAEIQAGAEAAKADIGEGPDWQIFWDTLSVDDVLALLAELTRIEQALEREGLAKVIEAAWGNPTWDGKTLRPIDRRLADEIRTHVLGDNEGKATL